MQGVIDVLRVQRAAPDADSCVFRVVGVGVLPGGNKAVGGIVAEVKRAVGQHIAVGIVGNRLIIVQGQAVVRVVGGAVVRDVTRRVVGIVLYRFLAGGKIYVDSLGDTIQLVISITQFYRFCKYLFIFDTPKYKKTPAPYGAGETVCFFVSQTNFQQDRKTAN